MRVVVDTNVAIAANGRNTHACIQCQLDCIEFLQKLTAEDNRHRVFLDDHELILNEYRVHLYHNGEPGVGDHFYKFLHDHLYTMSRVKLVTITPVNDETKGFAELPHNTFDINDRKFLAVALKAKATVCNAMDPDWHEHAEFVSDLGVKVKQLCPMYGCPQAVEGME